MLIRRQVENVPSIGEDASLDVVFDLFRRSPERSFFPVLNANGEPRGILREHRLKDMIYHPFGRDLLKNHMYQRRISHFVEAAPIADLDMPAEDILRVFASAQGGNCIILTERMRYAGILSAPALLRIIHGKQLKSAQDQNPLTGLLSDFAGDVRQLYSAEHRAAGEITTCGRDGMDQSFPLMRCSTAVLTIPAGNVFGDAQPISLRMAGLKKKAKASATSLVLETIA